MKFLFNTLIFVFLSFFTFDLSAQNGTIRGTVIDKEYNEPLIGVAVQIAGTTIGSSTDLDGNYSFSAPVGKHTLEFTYISYAKVVIQDVEVRADEITLINADLVEESLGIDEVVVTAKANRSSEAAVDKMRLKSDKVVDGISAQTFKRAGDGNAAAAIKRVTGVSVEGGKHVYVRGLGDRYTKTILNGLDIPGLDPERNNLQMDIFPSNLLDNIVVYKTFTPDLTGDFTGGLVDISTKDFPDKATFSASMSATYRPETHFNDNFFLYDGGKFDFLGFDDGTRSLGFDKDSDIPNEVLDDPKLEELTRSFDPEMAVSNQNNFLDYSFSLAGGNQINKEKVSIGYNVATSFSKTSQLNETVELGQYIYNQDRSTYDLQVDKLTNGSNAEKNYSWSIFGGLAFKTQSHKISLTAMRLQNANKTASRQFQRPINDGAENRDKTNLEFNQRAVNYLGLSGKHQLGKFELEWKNAFTLSTINDPDIRFTVFNVTEDNEYVFGDGSKAARIFRDLSEINESFRVDLTIPIETENGLKNKIKFGVANTYKHRNFESQQFNLLVKNDFEFDINGDPDWFLEEQNIWTPENPVGTYLSFTEQKSNNFDATINIMGAYAMTEWQFTPKLKTIIGLRWENISHIYSGQFGEGFNATIVNQIQLYNDDNLAYMAGITGQSSDANSVDVPKSKRNKFLPSLNLIYKLNDNMNLRGSYYHTVARPSFREKSFTVIRDRLSNITYIGNIFLQQTDIYNSDIRWEYFFGKGEMVSVSGFYKYFNNPIEVVANELASNELKAQNTDKAQMFGAEFEFRKNLGFITNALENISLGSNVTLVKTAVDMTEKEINGRNTNLRFDESETATTRQMFGQSPYIINAYLNFIHPETGIDANISYNVQGKRLAVVGLNVPDVYEQPFHSLNFKTSYKFGNENRYKLSFRVDNILGQKRVRQFESYNATPEVYSSLYNNRAFTLGFTYAY